MMCFRDSTFCPYSDTCNKQASCSRAITPEVKEAAVKWWGGEDYPMAVYTSKPSCHEERSSESSLTKL